MSWGGGPASVPVPVPAEAPAVQVELLGPHAGLSSPPRSAEPPGTLEDLLHRQSGVADNARKRQTAGRGQRPTGRLRLCRQARRRKNHGEQPGEELTGEVPELNHQLVNNVHFYNQGLSHGNIIGQLPGASRCPPPTIKKNATCCLHIVFSIR